MSTSTALGGASKKSYEQNCAWREGRFSQKTQILVAGCETDVCVLQSCLGLLSLDYEVYLMEELLFSSSPHVESAVARM